MNRLTKVSASKECLNCTIQRRFCGCVSTEVLRLFFGVVVLVRNLGGKTLVDILLYGSYNKYKLYGGVNHD